MNPNHDAKGEFSTGKGAAGAAATALGLKGAPGMDAKKVAEFKAGKGIPKVTEAHRQSTIDHFGKSQISAAKVHSFDGKGGGLAKSPATGENVKVVRVSDTSAYVVHPSEGQHGDSMSNVPNPADPAAAADKVLGNKDHVAAHNEGGFYEKHAAAMSPEKLKKLRLAAYERMSSGRPLEVDNSAAKARLAARAHDAAMRGKALKNSRALIKDKGWRPSY